MDVYGNIGPEKHLRHRIQQATICKADGRSRAEAFANGNLITASPDLLGALEELVDHFGQGKAWSGLLKNSRAAIAKAKGE